MCADLAERFRAAGVPTPAVDAELLVAHVAGWPRSRVRTHGGSELPAAAAAELEALAQRRCRREPLQLIVGSVGFRYLDIAVAPGVFIPRPETEILAGLAADHTPGGGVVVEPCTGTGAVACAVATEASPATVIATDLSLAACALAQRNAAGGGADVVVLHGDLLDPVPAALRGRVDVLVANPPYLAAAEMEGLEPEVTEHDPYEALVGGPTGSEVALRLVGEAPAWLAPGGWLLLEVDPARAEVTAAAMRVAGLVDVQIERDLTGAARFPLGRRPAAAG